jgi:hypothetical protein
MGPFSGRGPAFPTQSASTENKPNRAVISSMAQSSVKSASDIRALDPMERISNGAQFVTKSNLKFRPPCRAIHSD